MEKVVASQVLCMINFNGFIKMKLLDFTYGIFLNVSKAFYRVVFS